MRPETSDRGDSLPLSVAERIDEVCMRFEAAWQAGPMPRLEDFLGASEGTEREALLRALLRVELDYRLEGDDRPNTRDYEARLPGFKELIQQEMGRRGLAGLRSSSLLEPDSVPQTLDTNGTPDL